MRFQISTAMFVVLVLAVVFGLLRDDAGRVGVIVFGAGLAAVVGGLAAIMSLFRTIAALAEARTILGRLRALVATALVLLVGSTAMLTAMFGGAYLVRLAVP